MIPRSGSAVKPFIYLPWIASGGGCSRWASLVQRPGDLVVRPVQEGEPRLEHSPPPSRRTRRAQPIRDPALTFMRRIWYKAARIQGAHESSELRISRGSEVPSHGFLRCLPSPWSVLAGPGYAGQNRSRPGPRVFVAANAGMVTPQVLRDSSRKPYGCVPVAHALETG